MDDYSTDQVALVTGAASGIGLATAERLARLGLTVVAADLAESALQGEVGRLVRSGNKVVASSLDVRSVESVQSVMNNVTTDYGRLDVLVNSAGIARGSDVLSASNAEWDEVLSVNLTGCFLTIKAFLPLMAQRKYGRIINVASMTAKHGRGLVGGTHYAASKAGVLGLTKAVAVTAGPMGVTCNAVCPGIIETRMTADAPPESLEQIRSLTPVGRLGTPNDVAAVIAFLASRSAGFITGEDIDVNGGYYID
ncbi:MAG: SDR family NAD(P)-dependent oxidoreductase [Mycobacteriales bacterium]